MRCVSCGFENPDGMNFCGKCAAPLTPRCSQCGFENHSDFAFCGKCGSPLATQPVGKGKQAKRKPKLSQQTAKRDKPNQAKPHALKEPRAGAAEAERRTERTKRQTAVHPLPDTYISENTERNRSVLLMPQNTGFTVTAGAR
jgi:hypothetical protein